jgi:hypothetical protein
LAAIGLVAWLQGCGFARATEAPQAVIVELDRAALISLPQGRHQIILGNPLIARVTELKDCSQAVLTGLAFGETRMTVLDATGAVVMESLVRVKEAADNGITVYRGLERSSYFDCPRQCQPRLQLGDNLKSFADMSSQIRTLEGQAEAPRMEGGAGL